MTSKFKAMLAHNQKEYKFDEIHAMYRVKEKLKPPVYKYVPALISKPKKPLVKPKYYEKHIPVKKVGDMIDKGKLVKGRIVMGKNGVGWVRVEGIKREVRIEGVRRWNRSMDGDEVGVRFVGWKGWKEARETEGVEWDRWKRYVGGEDGVEEEGEN